MALSIDTCNDIEKYEESVVAGLNARKSIYAVVGVLLGGVRIMFLKNSSVMMHLNINSVCLITTTTLPRRVNFIKN